MTSPESPYQTPNNQMTNQPPPDLAVGNVREPGAIKTFGVLHLVIAGLGLVMLIFNTVATLFSKKIYSMQADLSGLNARMTDIQNAYISEMMPFTWASIAFSLILTVMLALAGIHLLKVRDKGRVLSLRYAWTSLAMKALLLLGTIIIVMPATKRMTEQMYEGIPASAAMNGAMSGIMPAMQLLSVLATCIYPVVVLVMMNNATIKSYLKNR
jgi:hypothetical protein